MIEPNAQINAVTNEPYSTLSQRVAEEVRAQLKRKPNSALGLPTGRTPTGMYKILADWSREGQLSLLQARCFGLDEYVDVDQSASFATYLEQNLYRHTDLPAESRFNPTQIEDYDTVIASYGGLDLTILGIGNNGHIAFNEPGTPLESWTHSIWLDESTRQSNAEFFKGVESTPTRAVTMGIQTILASDRIILMVSGKKKQNILVRALRGPVSSDVPASYLQKHRHVTVITDFDY